MKHPICMENRNQSYIEPRDIGITTSSLRLYEIKLKLELCRNCDDYCSLNGKDYCLQKYNGGK